MSKVTSSESSEPLVVVTPTKTKKVKKTTTPSVSVASPESTVVESVSIAPVSVVETSVVESSEQVTVSESEVVVSEESNTEILFNKLVNQFQDVQLVMKTLHSNLKLLQKEVLKERKESKKKESKIKRKSDKKRGPSGFAKPAPISDDLANFLGLADGAEIARTEVTSKVIAYVKEFNLQNPANKKQIIPDEKLNKLLKPAPEDVITFFNLQTHLKPHFLPSTVTSTSVESVTVV